MFFQSRMKGIPAIIVSIVVGVVLVACVGPKRPKVISIDADCNHTVALLGDGTVLSWGNDGVGPAGKAVPQQVKGLNQVKAVAAGQGFVLALKTDGTVWGVGKNDDGQLGDGSRTTRSEPVQVKALSGIVQIDACKTSAMALGADGSVWVWGDPQVGSNQRDQSLPERQTSLGKARKIIAGRAYYLASMQDGSIWVWPSKPLVVVDEESMIDSPPFQLQGMEGVTDVCGLFYDIFALGKSGNVQRWVENNVSDLSEMKDIVTLRNGYQHAFFISKDGGLTVWGENRFGQWGNGRKGEDFGAYSIAELHNIIDATGGEGHSVALASDGTVWVWGSNDQGQLGDGTTTDQLKPVVLKSLSPAGSIGKSSIGSEPAKDSALIQVADLPKDTSSNQSPQATYKTYRNEMFGFSFDYPESFDQKPVSTENNYVTEIPPNSPEGIDLTSPDWNVEIIAQGFATGGGSIQEEYNTVLGRHPDASYKVQKENWFVLSWVDESDPGRPAIVYLKTFMGNATGISVKMIYPKSDKEKCEPVVKQVFGSLKMPDLDRSL